jgi:hypothetical protein
MCNPRGDVGIAAAQPFKATERRSDFASHMWHQSLQMSRTQTAQLLGRYASLALFVRWKHPIGFACELCNSWAFIAGFSVQVCRDDITLVKGHETTLDSIRQGFTKKYPNSPHLLVTTTKTPNDPIHHIAFERAKGQDSSHHRSR